MESIALKKSSRQKFRNKQRYSSKGHPQSNKKPENAESNLLPSNHNRYVSSESEDDSNLNTNIRDVITDFAALAKAPISVGGHFKFKDDQNSFENDCQKSFSEWFAPLDIKMLSQSVSAIPFHIRCEIDQEFVKGKHLENYCRVAEENKDKFDGYLVSSHGLQKDSSCYFSGQICANNDCKNELQGNNEKCLGTEDNSKGFDSVSDSKSSRSEDEGPKDDVKEELEDWLDDILGS